jgi:hypothetical protein
MKTYSNNVVDIAHARLLKDLKDIKEGNAWRDLYGICELCGKKDRRLNGACAQCTEDYDL